MLCVCVRMYINIAHSSLRYEFSNAQASREQVDSVRAIARNMVSMRAVARDMVSMRPTGRKVVFPYVSLHTF